MEGMNCVFKMPCTVQAEEPSTNMYQIIKAKSSKFVIISLCINTNYFDIIIIKFGFLNSVARVVLVLLNFVLTNGLWHD